jgi:hypothetical protein
MKESVLHVQLMNGSGTRGGDAEDGADHRRFDNRAEGLIIVDTSLLGEATDDPARLVLSQSTVGVELVFEQPLVGDNIGAGGPRYEVLGAVGEESIVFR